jgi:hypothetical protein
MIKRIKYFFYKIKAWFSYRKKIKEIRKRDPFIYK